MKNKIEAAMMILTLACILFLTAIIFSLYAENVSLRYEQEVLDKRYNLLEQEHRKLLINSVNLYLEQYE